MRRFLWVTCLFACGGAAREPATPGEAPAEETPAAAEGAPPPPAAMQPQGPSSLEGEEPKDKPINSLQEAEQAFASDQSELDRLLAQPIASTTDAACRRVCSAIGSMRRSVDGICRLSDDRSRCDNAKKTLDKNERRVADSGCRC